MSKKIVAYHLCSDQEQTFLGSEPVICPEWAVAYSYAMENQRTSEILMILHDHRENLVPVLQDRFPLVYGQRTVGCGDWAALCVLPEEPTLRSLPH